METRMFTFKTADEEYPSTVPIRFNFARSRHISAAWDFEVRDGASTHRLKDWLKDFCKAKRLFRAAEDEDLDNHPYEFMRRWWKENGKKFRLGNLPPELRLMILRQLIGYDAFRSLRMRGAV
jgi:hypothetical protein